MNTNKIYIATSIDGFIADKNGELDWLHAIPNPNNDDMGFADFMNTIDALVMGRTTFETVLGFDVPWPYAKPVFVLSTRTNVIPDSHKDKAFLIKGQLKDVVAEINNKGYHHLYIDGGTTISNFLKEDLIDEMIISTIPVVLGGGAPLFSELPNPLNFELIDTKVQLGQISQRHFKRKR